MVLSENTAKKVAELLLQIKAIKLSPKNAFVWSSGLRSPIYCDNRVLLSYPKERDQVASMMSDQIKKTFDHLDIVVSVATGAIGIGMLVAKELGLPMAYVRPEAKKHGQRNKIEGKIVSKQKAVIIEDLISTGSSSLKAFQTLKEEGLQIGGVMAIFSYEFEMANDKFQQENCPLYTLSNYPQLLKKALEVDYIDKSDLEMLEKWRVNPQEYK